MKHSTHQPYLFKFTIFIGISLLSLLTTTSVIGQSDNQSIGLTADYYRGYFYDDIAFFQTHNPTITNRIIDNLQFVEAENDNFNIGSVATYYSPGKPDEFSARYRGKIYITTAGTYTFYLGSDDGASLWFDTDSKPVTSNVGDKTRYREASATKTLSAGFHDILLYYGEHGGSQGLVLEYAGPNLVRQVIPNGVFYPVASSATTPVLTQFTAAVQGQQVSLLWNTQVERDSRYFVVERSIDGTNFEEILRQPGAGSSLDPHDYKGLDQDAPTGTVYYRLRQELGSSKAVYSPITAVQVEKAPPASFSVYPNPNAGKFYLEIVQPTPKPATMQMLDMSGRELYQQQLPANINGEVYRIAPQLATGMYILRLKTSTGTITQKVVIAK